MMIREQISRQILTVGSEYKDHRGGIGAVIESYSTRFAVFKFLPSYGTENLSKTTVAKYYFTFLIRLYRKLNSDRDIKLVHIHGAAKGSFFRKYLVFNLCKRLFRKKVIFHSHASEMEVFYRSSSALIKWVCKDFFNNVDLIICLSKSWENFYRTNFNVKRVEILENIVPEPDFISPKVLSKPIQFLFLGRIGARKGIFDLIEVLAENAQFFSDKIQLTIGGDGESERLKRLIVEKKIDGFVEYKGWISGKYKVDLLRSSDVYILPSHNEGLPISILEAMSYGVVVASTFVGGIPEIIENGVNGFLFKAGDKIEIFKALQKIIEEQKEFDDYRTSSYKIVKNYYPSFVIPKLEKFYESLIC